MTQQILGPNTKLGKTLNPDEFDQILAAILDGKYSWACVLLLRSSGYNPGGYIPYRTYYRLLRENCQFSIQNRRQTDSISTDTKRLETASNGTSSQKCLSRFTDLSHLEVINQQHSQISGGSLDNLQQELDNKLWEYHLLRTLD